MASPTVFTLLYNLRTPLPTIRTTWQTHFDGLFYSPHSHPFTPSSEAPPSDGRHYKQLDENFSFSPLSAFISNAQKFCSEQPCTSLRGAFCYPNILYIVQWRWKMKNCSRFKGLQNLKARGDCKGALSEYANDMVNCSLL